jgi:hypothetical protein
MGVNEIIDNEPPRLKEVGASRIVEFRNVKISNIPWGKRIEVLISGILEIEVAQEQTGPGDPMMQRR